MPLIPASPEVMHSGSYPKKATKKLTAKGILPTSRCITPSWFEHTFLSIITSYKVALTSWGVKTVRSWSRENKKSDFPTILCEMFDNLIQSFANWKFLTYDNQQDPDCCRTYYSLANSVKYKHHSLVNIPYSCHSAVDIEVLHPSHTLKNLI